MPSAFDRLMDAARKRKAARERPFPQFTLRSMLLFTSLSAIGLGFARRVRMRLDAEELGFAAAIVACVVFAFLVAVVRQNRWLFVWGSVGGLIGALFCPPIYFNFLWDLPIPPFWQRFFVHLLVTLVPTLGGTLIGFAVPGCLARYESRRRACWKGSAEARARHGAMPRRLHVASGEDSGEMPPDGL